MRWVLVPVLSYYLDPSQFLERVTWHFQEHLSLLIYFFFLMNSVANPGEPPVVSAGTRGHQGDSLESPVILGFLIFKMRKDHLPYRIVNLLNALKVLRKATRAR